MNIQEILKEKNRTFNKASKNEKRILLAQEVLDLINANTLYPSHLWGHIYEPDKNFSPVGRQLNEYLLQEKGVCKACGVGSLVLAHVMYKNNCRSEEFLDLVQPWDLNATGYSLIFRKDYILRKYFPVSQLRLIELAFEGGKGGIMKWKNNEICAIDFYHAHSDDTNRLKKIMKNIIRNKGIFKP